ncbi:MAG: SpoIIE family protein phosphatase [Brevefilum sp.]|nr:SpoIIE family protein phosphatase [Brevefilum sp.]
MYSDVIREIPLFKNLPDDDLGSLAAASYECIFQPGEVLLREGFRNDYFFILLDGDVEIIKSLGTSDERRLGISTRGALLGEISRFSQGGTHTASVRAYTSCSLLRVPFSWLDAVLSRNPEMAYDLMRLYCSRLDHSENLTIKDLREKNRELTQAYNDLKIAQAAMIEKEKLEQEMRLASQIQRNILPKTLPYFPGLDIGALMIPAKQVGGDFYDFIILDDHRVGIVIGDVCDKGMPAALLMALTYSSVRMEALRKNSPSETLKAVNRHLLQIDCSDMFVTLIYGIFDNKSMTFDYARAGHPKPVLLDDDHQPLPVPYNLGQAVGIFEGFTLDHETLPIPEGGTLMIYSDGLSETLEDQENPPDLPQLCASILRSESTSAQGLCEELWKTAAGSSGESLIKDDFTVVVLRLEGRFGKNS